MKSAEGGEQQTFEDESEEEEGEEGTGEGRLISWHSK